MATIDPRRAEESGVLTVNWTEDQLQKHMENLKLPPVKLLVAQPSAIRIPKSEMNKVETRFAQYLEIQKRAGEIVDWWFESVRLKVGQDCWWKMDFLVRLPNDKLVIYDTKGTKRLRDGRTKPYAEEDAIVKARAVASKFPFEVYFVWQEKNGEWSTKKM